MLIRSASADVDANAQQLPQYCGMCWLRVTERYAVPLTLRLRVRHIEDMPELVEFWGHRVCAAGWPARLLHAHRPQRATLPDQCWLGRFLQKVFVIKLRVRVLEAHFRLRIRVDSQGSCGSHDNMHAQLPVVAHQSQAAGRSCSDFSS